MLGHKLFQHLRQSYPETRCTIRGSIHEPHLRNVELFHSGNVVEHFDAAHSLSLDRLLSKRTPEVVINCIGIVKQRAAAKETVPSIEINALLPHRLASACERQGSRLIHFSTDCVFSGKHGNYHEGNVSDAEDLYGRTKFLGELTTANAITLRTSIIGRELAHRESLLEWFLQQNHKSVSGYTRAMFSGITTNLMARVVAGLIARHPKLTGLYQVASPPISKCDLLTLLRDAYALDIQIDPESDLFCDRSMKGGKFAQAAGFICPPWPELVAELANDVTPYQQWK